MKNRSINWSAADWTKNNEQIARSLKTSATYVGMKRMTHAPMEHRSHKKNRSHDWSMVDWNKSNAEIAREMGTHYTYVCSRRARTGQPKSKETAISSLPEVDPNFTPMRLPTRYQVGQNAYVMRNNRGVRVPIRAISMIVTKTGVDAQYMLEGENHYRKECDVITNKEAFFKTIL